MAHAATTEFKPNGIPKPQTKAIWRTFWILSIITMFEFIVAFTMASGFTRVAIFLAMTVVKAFFIVAEFMHLKNETKSLMWSIVLPTVFILWAVVVFMYEGNSIYEVR